MDGIWHDAAASIVVAVDGATVQYHQNLCSDICAWKGQPYTAILEITFYWSEAILEETV